MDWIRDWYGTLILLATVSVLATAQQTNSQGGCELQISAYNSTGESVRARLGHTAAVDCRQFEIVRVAGLTNISGDPLVFVGDLDAPKAARRLYKQALAHLHRQEWKPAEKELAQAVRIHPTFARAYNALGVATSESGNFEAATSAFREAINLRTEYPEAYLNFAKSLARDRKFEDATALLEKLLSFDRENSVAMTLLAECFLDTEDFPRLIVFVREIHRENLVHDAAVHQYLAELYKERGMIPEFRSEVAIMAAESRAYP